MSLGLKSTGDAVNRQLQEQKDEFSCPEFRPSHPQRHHPPQFP